MADGVMSGVNRCLLGPARTELSRLLTKNVKRHAARAMLTASL